MQGEQGVSACKVWLEQGGDSHVLQVNKRVIEKRKGRGLFARLRPVRSDISSQAAAAPPSITPGDCKDPRPFRVPALLCNR